MSSVVIQYVDDILLASEDEMTHVRDLQTLLDHLHAKGHKASPDKAQIMQPQVTHLGQLVSLRPFKLQRNPLPLKMYVLSWACVTTTDVGWIRLLK